MSPSKEGQSSIVKLAHEWIDAFNNWEVSTSAIGELLSDIDYTHEILPKSLGRPVKNKEEWLAYYQEAMLLFQAWNVSSKVVDELRLIDQVIKAEILSIIEGAEEVSIHVNFFINLPSFD